VGSTADQSVVPKAKGGIFIVRVPVDGAAHDGSSGADGESAAFRVHKMRLLDAPDAQRH
jgi:hypothetical protein